MRERVYKIQLINYKINKPDATFDEKRNYIDFNIEQCMNYFTSLQPSNMLRRQELLMQAKTEIVKREFKQFLH